jgi:hypothetical protein
LNNDDEVAYIASVQSNEFTGKLIATTTSGVSVGELITLENSEEDMDFNVTSSMALFYNGEKAPTGTTAEDLVVNKADVKVVYDDDDVIQGIVAWEFELDEARRTYSVRNPLVVSGANGDLVLPATLDADDEEILDTENLTIEGDVDSLEDIEKGDLLYYYASKDGSDEDDNPDKVKLLVIRDTFEGKYTRELTAGSKWVVGGVTYEKGDFVDTFAAFELGDTLKLTLDKDENVYDIEIAEEATTETNYALFITATNGAVETIQNVKSVDTAPTVRLFTEGGDVVVYDMDLTGLDVTTTDSITVGAFNVDETLAITMNTTINFADLVTYELNSDGEVKSVDLATTTNLNTYDTTDKLINDSYDVIESTVVFNGDDDMSWNDWTIEGESYLDSSMEGVFAANTDDYYAEAVVVTSGGSVGTDETYAVVTDAISVFDEEQDDATIEYTMLVDGQEVEYLADIDSNPGSGFDETDLLVKVTIDEDTGLVTAIGTTVSHDNSGNEEVVEVYNEPDRIRVTGGALYTLQEGYDVYILEMDGTDTVASVGSLDDVLVEDDVMLYDTDGDDDGHIDVVILDLR